MRGGGDRIESILVRQLGELVASQEGVPTSRSLLLGGPTSCPSLGAKEDTEEIVFAMILALATTSELVLNFRGDRR